MRYATFLTIVERAGGLTPEQAEAATAATLRTLAERISGGEAEDIAAFLPRELRPLLAAPEPAEPFGLDELVRRIAQREGVDERAAMDHARAVFTALGFAVAPGELRDMAAQLPRDVEPLLEAAGLGREQALQDDLVGRVAELLGVSRATAQRATEAVLETLAVRISAGEVEDLEDELPGALHAALERGLAESRDATRMSAEEFVARVAAREGVDPEQAERHVRAVFTALRDAISGDEFADVASQLSQDYAPLLAVAP